MAKKQFVPYSNPVEILGDIRKELVSEIKDDLGKEAVKDAWRQLLGAEKKPQSQSSGQMQAGIEISLPQALKEAPRKAVEAGIDNFSSLVQGVERIRNERKAERRRGVDEIRMELREILTSTSEVDAKHSDLGVISEGPVQDNVYDETYWQEVRIEVREDLNAEKSEDWKSALVSKKDKKKTFWDLSKQHGTQYQLSGEHQVARNVG